jgi:LysR family transcriptional regulator, hydrogen peroxide-inducible genes activator
MNLRDLEYLVALAEHRHFGRAAAACYVSQPTLSTQLKKLEHELGVELIERGSRSVLLTRAGEQVVERAKLMLADADDIRGIARQARDPRTGTLRLGLFPTLAPYLLPHVVEPLHGRFPHLEILLVEAKTADLLAELTAGTLDAAVLALPIADESLYAEPLFREPFVLAVPAGDRLAAPSAGGGERLARPEDLVRQDLLLLEEGHCLRDQALEVCQLAGAHERDGFRATSLETLRHMVAAGVGVTLLPELAVRPPVPEYDGLRLLRFAPPAPHRDVALVSRRTSVYHELLAEVAHVLRGLPAGYVEPLGRPSGGRVGEVGGAGGVGVPTG